MSTARRPHRPVVVVVGGGAAGTLTALHLVRTASCRSTGLDIRVIDPADRCARGVAFGTRDTSHLLNVPASGMSALPEDPGHFVAWRHRDDPDRPSGPYDFAPREQFGRYLEQTLDEALASALGDVTLRHVRQWAVQVRRTSSGVRVTTDDGRTVPADGLVVATGLPAAGDEWADDDLRRSPFFVADPWAPGALDVVRRDHAGPPDVLLVGTGLTTVDVVLSLSLPGNRPDRTLHAVSRGGLLPCTHADEQQLAAIPDVSDWGHTLEEVRTHAERHVAEVRATTGDWRPAVDGLRFRLGELWRRLSEQDRATFIVRDAAAWNRHRHRMAPTSRKRLDELLAAGRLSITAAGGVAAAGPLTGGGLRVELGDGTVREVGWVVNCTGPQLDISRLGNPFLDDLLRPRGGAALAVPATAGMGVRTVDGRLVDSAGTTEAPVWALGALRRGELWESTAVPEIRQQALSVATGVLDALAPQPRRLADGRMVSGHHPVARPRDPLGLPISTTAEAASAYNAGLERLMLLQDGAEELIREASRLDPDFAVAHAALAMLGHEAGAAADVTSSLRAARQAIRRRGDDRERSLVDVVGRRVADVRRTGAQALMAHVARHPRDVLAVSAAVPTIAFSGVTDVQQEAWDLIEGLAPAYGDHWWYISLLAFTRQDQSRWEEAGLLAESALSCQPSSGHAVHAQTHVLYETGQHETGRIWLDHWVTESGRSASHRAHFSWHAALHELSLGDTEAVRRRYYSQLVPPTVTGVRALVDSASLLWRWRMTTTDWNHAVAGLRGAPDGAEAAPPPVDTVLAAVEVSLTDEPQTPFVALHSAIGLAGAGDVLRVSALAAHCRRSGDGTMRTVVATVCDAFVAVLEARWADAATLLDDALPVLVKVGGSAAQREVVEETLLLCLVSAGDVGQAAALLDGRLDRRPSPLDARRRTSLGSPLVRADASDRMVLS